MSATDSACAFTITTSATANLTLKGDNILKSGKGCAGLRVEGTSALTISGQGNLSATGGEGTSDVSGNGGGAGIGGNELADNGAVTITGGTITATGINGGAGIGGGGGAAFNAGNGGTIEISNSTVIATSTKGAGIGGGGVYSGTGYSGSGGIIKITNSTITVTSTDGAGIGGGSGSSTGGSGGTITITGSTVNATSTKGAGIGGGNGYTGGSGGTVTIKGGSVTAEQYRGQGYWQRQRHRHRQRRHPLGFGRRGPHAETPAPTPQRTIKTVPSSTRMETAWKYERPACYSCHSRGDSRRTVPRNGRGPRDSHHRNSAVYRLGDWSPGDHRRKVCCRYTEYTATITLRAKAGYTFDNVAANFFTVAGATATNGKNSSTVTAVFPKTAAAPAYSIKADVTDLNFDSATVGYTTAPAEKTVTVENTEQPERNAYPAHGHSLRPGGALQNGAYTDRNGHTHHPA